MARAQDTSKQSKKWQPMRLERAGSVGELVKLSSTGSRRDVSFIGCGGSSFRQFGGTNQSC